MGISDPIEFVAKALKRCLSPHPCHARWPAVSRFATRGRRKRARHIRPEIAYLVEEEPRRRMRGRPRPPTPSTPR